MYCGENGLIKTYRKIVKKDPYEHQRDVWKALTSGQPVVLRAPTGSGKTEAVFLPWLRFRGSVLPQRLIYALPLRSLANDVKERMAKHAGKLGGEWLKLRLQHGERPETVLFAADAIIGTIDQVITSYACTPLTLPVRHGNIPAGAVMSSFIAFDEVHLFDPMLALQATRLICERLKHLGLPFAILSATLPDAVLEFWKQLGCAVIDAEIEPIKREVQISCTDQPLEPHAVERAMKEGHQRILVVYNTVARAIQLFEALRNSANQQGYAFQLLHSRFLPDDRLDKERWVTDHFGRDAVSKEKALLIATQVVEVGLDISCDCLLTELAPVDALIQRAGRCARWGGRGIVQVYEVPSAVPYEETLVQKTREVLRLETPAQLAWTNVKKWVNEVLNDRYHAALTDQNFVTVVAALSSAAFKGDRRQAARTVRDSMTVEVSIYGDPHSLGPDVLRLPTISVHHAIARGWANAAENQVWRVEVDETPADERMSVRIVPVRKESICYGDRLIFAPGVLTYDSDHGLHEGKGQSFLPLRPKEQGELIRTPRKESWINHAINTVRCMTELLEREHHAVEGLAQMLRVCVEDVKRAAKLAALLHDVGKLTIVWQAKAGIESMAKAEELLAHTDARNDVHFPAHATVSAYAFWDTLTSENILPRLLGKAVVFAMAHHHSVRAKTVPKFKLHPQWTLAVERALLSNQLQIPLEGVIREQDSNAWLRDELPPLENEKEYTAYVLLARWLRFSDRVATSGSWDAIYEYEDWFGRR